MDNLNSNQKTIIILSGAKRSGKDTAAGFIKKYLLEAKQPPAISVAFADKLKNASAALLNEIYDTNVFTPEQFSNEEIRQGPYPSPEKFNWGGEQVCLRTVLQKFGTEVCRNNIDPAIWVKMLSDSLESIDSKYIIITDARFPNEIDTVVKRFKSTCKIITLLIKRPVVEGSTEHAAHASESNFNIMEENGMFSNVIDNDADLDRFDTKIRRFVYKNLVPPLDRPSTSVSRLKIKTENWFTPERGLREHLPEDQSIQNWLFDIFREVSAKHGFQEYSAPILEPEVMYKIKSGDEIVSQMYSFETKEHRRVALRPEITPSLVRMIANKDLKTIGNLPLRWFSIGECFRHESVTVGRFREHVQWNADIIGENQANAELDLLVLITDFFKSVNLTSKDIVIKISNRLIVDSILTQIGITTETNRKLVYTTLDKLYKLEETEIRDSLETFCTPEQMEQVLKFKNVNSLQSLEETFGTDHNGIETIKFLMNPDFGLTEWLQFDLGTVRGLGYYTGVIFEAFDRAGQFRSICGGGRYDLLMHTLTGGTQSSPMIGFGFGDCVIKEVLKDLGKLPTLSFKIDYCVIPFDKTLQSVAFKVAHDLRERGWSTVLIKPTGPRKVFKGYDYANKIGAKFAILVAPDEVATGTVRVKDLRKGFDPDDRGYNVDLDTIGSKGK